MTPPDYLLVFLLLLQVAASQMPAGSCSGCGPLSLPLLAGLVAADAVLSLLIVGWCLYVCANTTGLPTTTAESTSTCLAEADLCDF